MSQLEAALRLLIPEARKRDLPFLLIGGNAMILLGYARNTLDVDFLVPAERRSAWLDLLREQGYRLYHGSAVFAQFEPGSETEGTPLDLMFVDKNTWLSLSSEAQTARLAGEEILIPRPEHLIALKLHSAKSPHRLNAEQDWEDIRQIIRCCELDPHDADFQKLIARFGDESALQKILNFPL